MLWACWLILARCSSLHPQGVLLGLVEARAVFVTPCQRDILERIIRARQSSQVHVVRARIILYAAEGLINEQIAESLSIRRQRVNTWRPRWADSYSVDIFPK